MAEPGRGPDLPGKPVGAKQRAQFGAEDLDRHLAVVLEVVGQVDGRHSAVAELAQDGVAPGQGGGEAVEGGGHIMKLQRNIEGRGSGNEPPYFGQCQWSQLRKRLIGCGRGTSGSPRTSAAPMPT